MNIYKPELTIITPVYKVEEYIEKCLDSIISQTFTDWELILVDDGSPDNSGVICDRYASEDSRIRVIHKENEGAAVARNVALDIAKGRYITFIDSDDEYGTSTTLQENLAIVKSDPVIDFLQYPYVYLDNILDKKYYVREAYVRSSAEVFSNILDNRIRGYLCIKIFKASLFDGVRFPTDVRVTEDLRVLMSLLGKVNTVYFSEYGVYNYYKRENSLVVLKSRDKELDVLDTYKRMLSMASGYPGVEIGAFAKRFFMTLSQILNIEIMFGGGCKDELHVLCQYMPSWKLLFGRLKFSTKWKILQVKVLGIDRFARWNMYFKQRRLNRQKKY